MKHDTNQTSYIVSVVTPFHNTNLEYFAHCFESMATQTIGFENVEWVITMHNSEPEYVQAVRSMAAPYPNIKLFELYNDNRTASSPRNECLKHVTAKYVCFLDADDYYYPDCLEVAVRMMEENGGDMGSFRTEVKRTGTAKKVFDVMVLEMDQTQPVIVCQKGDKRIGRMFNPMNGPVWNKIFLRELIEDNGITFQEDVRLGEDICFNLDCLKHVNTFVAMPQHIGNVYFRNAGSLLESATEDNVEGAMQFLNDILHWTKGALDTGYDVSNLLWLPLTDAARRLSTPGLPQKELKELTDQYAELIPKIPPIRLTKKRQIFTQEQMDGMMEMVKAAFIQGDTAAASHSFNTLVRILAMNQDTELGLKYNFETIRTYSAFTSQVPLSDYSFYAPLIELTTRLAESNIFCAEPLSGYALTSGTEGPIKRVPYTTRHMDAYAAFLWNILERHDTLLLMGGLPHELEYKDGTFLDSISGAALREIKDRVHGVSFARRRKVGMVTSPSELLFPEQAIDPRYARLLFALLDPDVTRIVAPFTWTVLDTLQFLEKHHARLADDIEKGCISFDDELPQSLKDALQSHLKPSPERAAELREIFSQSFEGIVERIWPKCRRIVAAGTGAFALYTRKLRRYCGNVKLDNGLYAASEAVIGRSLGVDTNKYRLVSGNAFFEFLEPGADAPVMAEDVEPGREYEVIVTNNAGLYRYRLGDVIRISRLEENTPIFTFEYRAEDCCDLLEVRITGSELERAIAELESTSGAEILDFCSSADNAGALTLFLEVAEDDGHSTTLTASLADEILQTASADYAKGRESGSIPELHLRFLQPQTHLLYRDRKMFQEKTAPDQIKPVRVLATDEQRRFFTALSE